MARPTIGSEMTEPESREPQRDGHWFDPLFDDSMLWPLLAVGVMVAASLLSSLLVLALADGRLPAMAGVALAAGGTIWLIGGAPLRVRLVLAATWLGAMAIAWWFVGLGAPS